MPHAKSRAAQRIAALPRVHDHAPREPSTVDRSGAAYTVGCVAHDSCERDVVDGSPVRLCAHHIREVYEFAQDLVAQRWDGAVREYVADLHDTFKPPRSVLKRPKQGYVYFVRLGDRVKIGYSENVPQRLAAVPHEEVLGVIPGTMDDEQGWHQLLADYRTVGEWFRADDDVLAAIGRVVASAS